MGPTHRAGSAQEDSILKTKRRVWAGVYRKSQEVCDSTFDNVLSLVKKIKKKNSQNEVDFSNERRSHYMYLAPDNSVKWKKKIYNQNTRI